MFELCLSGYTYLRLLFSTWEKSGINNWLEKSEINISNQERFITCSKLIINELGLCPTRSNNIYFANNEQTSLAFTDMFCFAHAEHNLIKLKLYN